MSARRELCKKKTIHKKPYHFVMYRCELTWKVCCDMVSWSRGQESSSNELAHTVICLHQYRIACSWSHIVDSKHVSRGSPWVWWCHVTCINVKYNTLAWSTYVSFTNTHKPSLLLHTVPLHHSCALTSWYIHHTKKALTNTQYACSDKHAQISTRAYVKQQHGAMVKHVDPLLWATFYWVYS